MSRTAGTRATCDTMRSTSGERISHVTSAPSRSTVYARPSRTVGGPIVMRDSRASCASVSASSGSTPFFSAASAIARYMPPVSRNEVAEPLRDERADRALPGAGRSVDRDRPWCRHAACPGRSDGAAPKPSVRAAPRPYGSGPPARGGPRRRAFARSTTRVGSASRGRSQAARTRRPPARDAARRRASRGATPRESRASPVALGRAVHGLTTGARGGAARGGTAARAQRCLRARRRARSPLQRCGLVARAAARRSASSAIRSLSL